MSAFLYLLPFVYKVIIAVTLWELRREKEGCPYKREASTIYALHPHCDVLIPQTNTHLNPISLVIWSFYFRFILKQQFFLWQSYDYIAVTHPIENICTMKTRHEIAWTDIRFPNSTLIIDHLVRTASKAVYLIFIHLHVASYMTCKISLFYIY